MKLASVVTLAAATALAAVSAEDATVAPRAPSPAPPVDTSATAAAAGTSMLAKYKQTSTTDAYHMEPIRVVHTRVQSDSPILVEGLLVSSFGKGKLEAGYLSSLDSMNTASVEGALMFVQALTINVATRDASERCVRKTKVTNIVFYEILIAQTNETIAQFQADWEVPEYGPLVPFDGGHCTETEPGKLPATCYQFNGEKGQPNLGPFVGIKNNEVSDYAPYPGNYWFSFPNTCPTATWGNKTDACLASTRKGLCPVGVAPNGVECTFAYNILGWVPIDDVVGITSIENKATEKPFANFSQWCKASEDNIEFSFDLTSKKLKTSLPFWADPLSATANAARTQKMLDTYAASLTTPSSQVDPKAAAAFQALPTPAELAKANPPCYKSVAACGSGTGCKRVGYSQLCTPCKAAEKCATGDGSFKFPTLTKAFTTLSDSKTKTKTNSPAAGGSSTSTDKTTTSTDTTDKTDTATNGGKSQSTVPLIGGVAAALLLVAFVAAIVVVRRRRRQAKTEGPGDADYRTVIVAGTDTGTTSADTGTGSGSGSAKKKKKMDKQDELDELDRNVTLWHDRDLASLKVSANDVKDVQMIGRGAFADVWLVRFRDAELLVSKRLRKSDVSHARTQDFIKEIKLVATLSHPNIVALRCVTWITETDLQALFEYMDGGDLRSYLTNPQVPVQWSAEKFEIAIDVAEALVYVHSFAPPLVHRDLKSRNVLLSRPDAEKRGTARAKLTDFGVSRYQSEQHTMTAGVGTGRWLAPEVIAGSDDYGPAADIYSFGVLLFELDTHEIPYAGARGKNGHLLAEVAILQRVALGELAPTLSAACPAAIVELATRCFALSPTDRPKAPEVAFALRSLRKSLGGLYM